MLNAFDELLGKDIPILGWSFFLSHAAATDHFNSGNWKWWQEHWTPVASDATGDAVVLVKDSVSIINHETGAEVKTGFKCHEDAAVLCKSLIEIDDYTECKSVDLLRKIKAHVQELKPLFPIKLRYYAIDHIKDIQEAINDCKWKSTEYGAYSTEVEEYARQVYKELRAGGRYNSFYIGKSPKERKERNVVLAGWLEGAETLEEALMIVERFPSPYPIKVGKIIRE